MTMGKDPPALAGGKVMIFLPLEHGLMFFVCGPDSIGTNDKMTSQRSLRFSGELDL